MITINNIETFKQAVTEMIAKRNGYRKNRARKYYIKSMETNEHIIVQNVYRFQMQFGKSVVWSDLICYNKSTNTITLCDGSSKWKDFEKINIFCLEPMAINNMGEKVETCYNLNNEEMIIKSF